ncbi:hypothetical protein BDV18DRAFT_140669 [Aspergillus unguis]
MSLPKLASSPSLSSQPSKQSLRHPTSRPQSINQQPDEHQSPHIDSHLAENEEQVHHELPSSPNIISHPFFTLIEDAHTSEYYHPTVHYIFSDDDTDIVTEAALRSLEADQDPSSNTNLNTKGKSRVTHQSTADQHSEVDEGSYEESPTRKESFLPERIPGVRDNYIILDIDHIVPNQDDDHPAGTPPELPTQAAQPGGQTPDLLGSHNPQAQTQQSFPLPGHLTIASAHSLSPTWQVLNTQLLPAPTFETNSPAEKHTSASANGGLMLQIQGTSGLPVESTSKEKEKGGQRLEDMMEQFARRLDELRLVIEGGERGSSVDVGEAIQGPDLSKGVRTDDMGTAGAAPETEADEAHGAAVSGGK